MPVKVPRADLRRYSFHFRDCCWVRSAKERARDLASSNASNLAQFFSPGTHAIATLSPSHRRLPSWLASAFPCSYSVGLGGAPSLPVAARIALVTAGTIAEVRHRAREVVRRGAHRARGDLLMPGARPGLISSGLRGAMGLGVGRVTTAPFSSPIGGTQPADGCGP
jgi:hypothetical protein